MLEGDEPEVRIIIDCLGDGRPWSVYRSRSFVAGGDIRRGTIGWGIREAGKLLDVSRGHYNDIASKVEDACDGATAACVDVQPVLEVPVAPQGQIGLDLLQLDRSQAIGHRREHAQRWRAVVRAGPAVH